MKICFATNNKNKLKEVQAILPPTFVLVSLEEIGCTEELSETADTLEENSFQKASYVFNRYHIPCFADDSGLEVDALAGAPGVHSARYAGPQRSDEDNIKLLLSRLDGKQNRKAYFRTVITLMGVEEEPLFFEGRVDGVILTEKRGHQGFGYDPVFVPERFGETFAEMDLSQKNAISHRGIAIRKLASYLSSRSNDWEKPAKF